jgi:hypothetical protein
MKAPEPSEASIQKSIVRFIKIAAPQCLIFAIPNGARRTANGYAANAVPGLTPGVADLCLVAPGGKAHFIEVKNAKGRVSEQQNWFLGCCDERDIPYRVVRSIDDVRAAMADWKIKTKEAA